MYNEAVSLFILRYIFNWYIASSLCALWVCVLVASLSGCTAEPEMAMVQKEGYRPIYLTYEQMRQLASTGPNTLEHTNKIYVRGSYIFINKLSLLY